MTAIASEVRLVLRSRLAAAALVLMLVLGGLSVWTGLHNVARQNATIDRSLAAQTADLKAVAAAHGGPQAEAGDAAYYTFLATWDRPPPLAFAALGQRDVQPFMLRIRALGLQSQLYESETLNPELALAGSFDFAFVLVFLAPLIVIALTHDLVSGEREAGRLPLLSSMPGARGRLWGRRVAVRFGLLVAALLPPLVVGLVLSEAPPLLGVGVALVTVLYLAFWLGACLIVTAVVTASATSAAVLVGAWIMLTLVGPTLANAAITRAVPVAKGIDLTLAQRELVHRAWDIPKEETFKPFFVNHPQWKDTAPVTERFHWKWYFAFHQVADERVADQVSAYRGSLREREMWSERAGWLLPPVAAQRALHRLADTDIEAHLSFQDSVGDLHRRLRHFLYPYLFEERPFTAASFRALPAYQPRRATAQWPPGPRYALLIAAVASLVLGLHQARKVSSVGRS